MCVFGSVFTLPALHLYPQPAQKLHRSGRNIQTLTEESKICEKKPKNCQDAVKTWREVCRTAVCSSSGVFSSFLPPQLSLMFAIWETPEGLHLFASWLGAPKSFLLPPLATHAAAPPGMEWARVRGWRQREGLRVGEGIARGLKAVREREQKRQEGGGGVLSFQSQAHCPLDRFQSSRGFRLCVLTLHILFHVCIYTRLFPTVSSTNPHPIFLSSASACTLPLLVSSFSSSLSPPPLSLRDRTTLICTDLFRSH